MITVMKTGAKRKLEIKTSWFAIRNNVPICLNCAYNQIGDSSRCLCGWG